MAPGPEPDKYQPGAPREPTQFESEVIVSPDTRRAERVPPGQTRTRKWPVLQAGPVEHVDRAGWQLEVFGQVGSPVSFTLEQFQQLPRVKVYADFHCVTRWSRLDNLWEGVAMSELLMRAGIKPSARFVVLHALDGGWTTNIPLADFLADDALAADTHDGKPLSDDHGGPVRAVIPRLYAWKSAKWLRAIELTVENRPGHWEREGYHDHGDPWTEERFGSEEIPPGYLDPVEDVD